MALWYAASIIVGLVVGSFLNVCIHRVPLGRSVVYPPSSCPSCGSNIRPIHNIPVISYMFLRGRCASCQARISPVYPAVELLNALLYAAALYVFGPGPRALVVMALMSAFVVVTFIDIRHRIIPDGITLPGIALGLVLGPLVMGIGWLDSVIGVLAGGGLLLGVGILGSLALGKESMGGGDVKLMAMVGAFVGWKLVLIAIFIGSLLGSAVGVTLIAAKVMERRTPMPFGPFLVAGAAVSVFFGRRIMEIYGALFFPPFV